MGSTWTATTTVDAQPGGVLTALTDAEVIRRWSPFAFELDGDDDRLRAGSRTAVTGRLAGIPARFDVQVFAADERGLRLRADGPIPLDVEYRIEARGPRADVHAAVTLAPANGLAGRVLSKAVGGALGAGVLESALTRMAAVAASAA